MSFLAAALPAANESCIGTGCSQPGTSHAAAYVLGIVLILIGVGVFFLAHRRNRRQRAEITEPQAASLGVTLGRALALLVAFIGVLCVLFPF